eukprot:CAMPEP_0118901512 /NCGR_PEP_ID=MMETSP1166-20130328/7186_1 /TAXON_ID=1104430 /ORGANISM="Chrysoreinhardia sp, Strain CCMP3193" /LENGTH=724 /DNA_ID=CAMNT_0006840689 /DNA_START=35 /DNA_END=2205 /DNA_ORIENTATION=+
MATESPRRVNLPLDDGESSGDEEKSGRPRSFYSLSREIVEKKRREQKRDFQKLLLCSHGSKPRPGNAACSPPKEKKRRDVPHRREKLNYSAFVPAFVVRRLRKRRDESSSSELEFHEITKGAVLAVRLFGLSEVVEKLSPHFSGPRGICAEFDALFTALTDEIDAFKGDVVKLCDGSVDVLAAWTFGSPKSATKAAARCAKRIRDICTCKIAAGLACGDLGCLNFAPRGPDGLRTYAEFVLLGSTASEARRACFNAKPGDIVVSKAAAAHLSPAPAPAPAAPAPAPAAEKNAALDKEDKNRPGGEKNLDFDDDDDDPDFRGRLSFGEVDDDDFEDDDDEPPGATLSQNTAGFALALPQKKTEESILLELEESFTEDSASSSDSDLGASSSRRGRRPVDVADLALRSLTLFVPRAFDRALRFRYSYASYAQHATISEVREVAVCAARVRGFDVSSARRARDVVDLLYAVAEKTSGNLLKLAACPDDDGLDALVVYGLPGAVFDEYALRAVAAADLLRDRAATKGLGLVAAVATNRAFCGVVGSPRRMEYCVIGDAVDEARRVLALHDDHHFGGGGGGQTRLSDDGLPSTTTTTRGQDFCPRSSSHRHHHSGGGFRSSFSFGGTDNDDDDNDDENDDDDEAYSEEMINSYGGVVAVCKTTVKQTKHEVDYDAAVFTDTGTLSSRWSASSSPRRKAGGLGSPFASRHSYHPAGTAGFRGGTHQHLGG